MKKLFLISLLSLNFLCPVFSQTGPHIDEIDNRKYSFSLDKTRILTVTYDALGFWDTETGNLVWGKKYSDLGLPQPYDAFSYTLSPDKKYLMLKSGGAQPAYIINLQTFIAKKTQLSPGQIMADNTVLIGDNYGNVTRWDIETQQQLEWKHFKNSFISDDRTKVIIPSGKKYKAYDIYTKKIESYDYQRESYGSPGTPVPGDHFIKLAYKDSVVHVYNKEGKVITQFTLKEGATMPEDARIIGVSATKPHMYVLENNHIYSPNHIYQGYINCYEIPSGKHLWKAELNASNEDIKQAQAKKKAEEDAFARKKTEERERKMANARPGYKVFDSKFTRLSIPYTMDYNSAQGFELTGDQFASSAFRLNSGSVLFGMGKICSCDDNTSYLVMIRNQGQSADRSNFLIATYGLDGSEINVRNIGTTQKDPSGVIRFDFTVSGGGCSFTINGKTSHPNGHVESSQVQLLNCR